MLDLLKRKLRPDRTAQPPPISPPSNGHRTQDLPFDPPFGPMLTLLHSRPLSAYLAPSSTGGGNLTASGAIQMPYSIPTPAQDEFRHACGSWMRQGFDWPAWARTQRGKSLMAGEEGSVESASREEVGALVTAMLRSDRFCEGAFAGYCERGMAGRVLERVEQLWEEENGSGGRSEEKVTEGAKEGKGSCQA